MDADFGMAADFRKATYFLDFLYLLIFVSGAVLPPWEGWHPRALRCLFFPHGCGLGNSAPRSSEGPVFRRARLRLRGLAAESAHDGILPTSCVASDPFRGLHQTDAEDALDRKSVV